MRSKLFKTTFQPNSYLTSVSRRGIVNPSSLTFSNINLTQVMTNLLVVPKITEKWLQNVYFHRYNFNMSCKSFSSLSSLCCLSLNLNFLEYQTDNSNVGFTCCLEIQSKMAEISCIFTLNSLKLP